MISPKPFPLFKLRRSCNTNQGMKQNILILRPLWCCNEGIKQVVKGDFFASFFVRTKNEEDITLPHIRQLLPFIKISHMMNSRLSSGDGYAIHLIAEMTYSDSYA